MDSERDPKLLAFELALIRDPRFAADVNDIVQEGGNARYQGLMDRYLRGDDVPYSALSAVWEESTQWQIGGAGRRGGNVPEPYKTIREVNARLPAHRKIRVLLGDPPIDWDRVRTREDHWKWIEMRDSYPAALIQLQVLARERRALVLFGQMHAQRRQLAANYDMSSWQAQTLVSVLERTTPTSVFSVWWLEKGPPPVAASWPIPGLAMLRGTDLGAMDFGDFASWPTRVAIRDNQLVPVPRNEWQVLRLEDQFDAVLYLGSPSNRQSVAPVSARSICTEQAYLKERLRRLELVAPPGEADRLKQLCASPAPK